MQAVQRHTAAQSQHNRDEPDRPLIPATDHRTPGPIAGAGLPGLIFASVVLSAMLGAIAFMLVDSPLDAPPALFGGGTTRAEAAKRRQRKQERRRRRKERRRNSSPAKPSAAQALEVLGLKAGATEQEIRAAYTRLMKRVHPDFGESNFFATQLNEVTQLSCGRGADRTTLLEVVDGSMKIDGQYDRDTGAMLFQLHRYIETWVGPRCAEYEGGCAVCYMWAIYDKLAKYTQ